MKITVTKREIEHGHICCPIGCPTALAIRRKTGDHTAIVDRDHARAAGKFYQLPPEAVEFEWKFCRQQAVQPYSFEMTEDPDFVPAAPPSREELEAEFERSKYKFDLYSARVNGWPPPPAPPCTREQERAWCAECKRLDEEERIRRGWPPPPPPRHPEI